MKQIILLLLLTSYAAFADEREEIAQAISEGNCDVNRNNAVHYVHQLIIR